MSDDITQVDPMNSTKMNSQVIESLQTETTVVLDSNIQCYWNGAKFPDGSIVCDSGVAYKCHMGHWLKVDTDC